MEGNTLLAIIGGVVVLIFIIIAVIIRIKTKPSAYDKEAASNFLNGLSETFYNKMMEIITNINFSEYDSLIEMEADIIKQIYDSVWDYTEVELAKAAKSDILTAVALKLLDKNSVLKFVDELMEKYEIAQKLETAWAEDFEKRTKGLAEKDTELEKTFSDESQYIENVSESDLKPAEQIEPTEEELASLNPPLDEVDDYDPENDESVEVVEDDTYIDKNGRKRSKATGRYV